MIIGNNDLKEQVLKYSLQLFLINLHSLENCIWNKLKLQESILRLRV